MLPKETRIRRRPALTYNLGPTINFLGTEQLNQYRNGLPIRIEPPGTNYTVYEGIDYSYVPKGNSRKFFEFPQNEDSFFIGKSFINSNQKRKVFYYYGYRVVTEYFDTNVLIDVQNKIEDMDSPQRYFFKKGNKVSNGPSREDIIRQLAMFLEKNYSVQITGSNQIINVSKKDAYGN